MSQLEIIAHVIFLVARDVLDICHTMHASGILRVLASVLVEQTGSYCKQAWQRAAL